MSYDVDLYIDAGGPELINIYDWNYTSNCAPMWREAGCDLLDFHGRTAGELGVAVRSAITEMETDKEHYEAMNPGNRWGSRESLVEAFGKLAEMCERAPRAVIHVSH